MFPLGERVDAPSRQEHEEEPPQVLLGFFGYSHMPLNLQAIPLFRETARSHIGRMECPTTIFLELPGLDEERARGVERTMDAIGYRKFLLRNQFIRRYRREPAMSELNVCLERITSLLERNDLDGILEQRLLPREEVQLYLFMAEIDRFRENRQPVAVRLESYPTKQARTMRDAVKRAEYYDGESVAKWRRGQFAGMIWLRRKLSELHSTLGVDRDKKTAVTQANIVNDTVSQNGSSSMLFVYGAGHKEIVRRVAEHIRHINPKRAISTYMVIATEQEAADLKIHIRAGEQIDDVLLARDCFETVCIEDIEARCRARKEIFVFAHNWMTIYATVVHVVASLSLEQLRQLCGERKDPIALLRNHPLAEPIGEYLR